MQNDLLENNKRWSLIMTNTNAKKKSLLSFSLDDESSRFYFLKISSIKNTKII
jgi:hypothetical protein